MVPDGSDQRKKETALTDRGRASADNKAKYGSDTVCGFVAFKAEVQTTPTALITRVTT